MFNRRNLAQKFKVSLVSLFVGSLLFVNQVSAQAVQIPNPVRFNSLEDVVNFLLTNVVRQVVVVAFVGLLIYGGWVRMTAQDDAKKIERSTQIIIAAIVGFAIIVLAPVIVEFVGSVIGVQGPVL